MSICYFYRMTSDTGFAPCVFEDNYKPSSLLSLACCKGGQIRKGKPVCTGLRYWIGSLYRDAEGYCKDEVYAAGIFKNRIVYCARIQRIPTMNEYFSDLSYANRMDQIYRVSSEGGYNAGSGAVFSKQLIRNNRHLSFHGKDMEEQHLRDELGQYVLLSDEFSYYGKEEKLIPDEIMKLMPKKQETVHYDSNSLIESFVRKVCNETIHSKTPTEKLTDNGCGGCKAK